MFIAFLLHILYFMIDHCGLYKTNKIDKILNYCQSQYVKWGHESREFLASSFRTVIENTEGGETVKLSANKGVFCLDFKQEPWKFSLSCKDVMFSSTLLIHVFYLVLNDAVFSVCPCILASGWTWGTTLRMILDCLGNTKMQCHIYADPHGVYICLISELDNLDPVLVNCSHIISKVNLFVL